MGNFGVGAYGTYQSLLMLRSLYQRGLEPEIVIYGLIDHHEVRNIAHFDWLMMISRYSKRGHISTPYCSLDANGQLREHPPIAYPIVPLREHLALVDFLTQAFYRFDPRERTRVRNSEEITGKIMLEMARLAAQNGASFYVAVLSESEETSRPHDALLARAGARVLSVGSSLSPDLTVPGEGHPNGRAHSLWAGKLESALRSDLARAR